MAIGGSVQSISIGGRLFAVAADAAFSVFLGGYTNETEANGDGTARLIKTAAPWKIDGIVVNIDNLNGDDLYLQNIANSNEYTTVTVNFASGAIYEGQGQITGDLMTDSQKTTSSFTLSGTGILSRQV